jgi:hypothetical protein
MKHKKSRDAHKNQQELRSAFQLLSKLNILSGGDGGGGHFAFLFLLLYSYLCNKGAYDNLLN